MMSRGLRCFGFGLLLVMAMPVAGDARIPADPLDSAQWETMYRLFLSDHPVVFDDEVKVLIAHTAENSLEVPVMVDASALAGVKRMIVFADFNPIPKILEFEPLQAQARIGFRFKVEQATPVRAAVLTEEGRWHVGGNWLDAAVRCRALPAPIRCGPRALEKSMRVCGRAKTTGDSSSASCIRWTRGWQPAFRRSSLSHWKSAIRRENPSPPYDPSSQSRRIRFSLWIFLVGDRCP